MKVPKNINQKLRNVEIRNRVFIYDATIIIEFLNKTFMPLNYHIKPEFISHVGIGFDINKSHLKNPERYDELFSQYTLGTVYDFYKMFRQHVDYTAPVESYFKFSVIMRKLIFSKNGWQFKIRRVGRAQLWYLGPLELRSRVPAEAKAEYPVPKNEVQTVDVETKDINEEETDDENYEVAFDENDEEVIVEKRPMTDDEIFPEEHIPVGPEKIEVSISTKNIEIEKEDLSVKNEVVQSDLSVYGRFGFTGNTGPTGPTGATGPNDPTLV